MENIEKILTNNPFWIYVGSPNLWQNLPPARGIDIVDFIHEKRQDDKLNNEQLKEVIMGMLGEKKEFKTEGKIIDFPKSKSLDKSHIESKLLELVEKNLKPSQETLELNEIARDSGLHPNEVKDIYQSLKGEADSKELNIDLSVKLDNILDAENQDLNLSSVLPAKIAIHLVDLASSARSPTLYFSIKKHPQNQCGMNCRLGF